MFIKDASDENVQTIIKVLQDSAKNHKRFRAFVYFLDGNKAQLKKLNKKMKADKVAFCLIPESHKKETLGLYKINPKAKSTTIVYKQRNVTKTIVNFNAENDTKQLKTAINAVCE